MMLALGAMSQALDVLTSLTQPKPAGKATGFGQSKAAFDPPGSPAAPLPAAGTGFSAQGNGLSPATLGAMLAALGHSCGSSTDASASAPDPMQDLFGQLDADRDGRVSKSEFQTGLGAGGANAAMAGSVFGRLDNNGDGSVSLEELSAALRPTEKHHRHGFGGSNGGSGGGAADPLLQALAGAPGSTPANGDRGFTPPQAAADRSSVSQMSAASAANIAASSYNFVEQLMQSQHKAMAATPTSTVWFTA